MRRRRLIPAAKTLVKRAAGPRFYPKPVSSLQPSRLYAYLDALYRRRELDGAVLEVGCWLGGTAAIAHTMLVEIGHPKRYVCVDTFSGFDPGQFARDEELGTPPRLGGWYTANSVDVVRRLLRHYGAEAVELVEADIATVDPALLPERVAVCLMDVDLEIPIHEGLRRVVDRLVPGGVVLVDDCASELWKGARSGYTAFVRERGLSERYFLGMGVVEAPS